MDATHDMRRNYELDTLTESEAGDDPMALFACWFEQAKQTNRRAWFEANAMTLATVDQAGQPDARIVLLKEHDEDHFTFYTNTASTKGQQLAENDHAALVFYWAELERQVRVRGPVKRIPHEQAQAYFRGRPRGSQLGAAASKQSQPVADREMLESRLKALDQQHMKAIPMPDDWGGYTLTVQAIEFWQGRPNRLHDRLLYTRDEDGWVRERLSP